MNHRWIAWPSVALLGFASAHGLELPWFIIVLIAGSGLFISGVMLGAEGK